MESALENNMPAVAITDHGVMYGIIDFYKEARQRGVKPILGCETYVAPESRFDRKSDGKGAARHLVLLAQDNAGYHNLVRLISSAHLEGFYYKPRIDKEILAQYSKGIIGLSACLKGEVATHLVNDDMKAAAKAAGQYAEILGKDSFFLEVQDNGLPEQRKANRLFKELSTRTGLPLVATNDVHYLRKEHADAHEVMLCLQTQTVMTDPKRMRYQTNEFYMKNTEEMRAVFREFPEAVDHTVAISERCNVELQFGKLHFPTFEVPKGFTQKSYLIKLGHEGMQRCYGIEDPSSPKDGTQKNIIARFNEELRVIEKTGYLNYYLVVWDFVNYARRNRIPVGPGRGSGGGSLIAYALGITSIDPLQYDLIFERFLNLERVSPPDFDVDFCQARREKVIEYVKEKYGRDNVAQIVTFGSLGAKSVIRDVGRVLEIPYAKCDNLSKMVPDDPKMSLKRALELNPEFKHTYETDPESKRILDYGFVLEGLYRNPGTHAAGVVIGEKPLVEIIPLSQDKEKQVITQYPMEPLGDIGLLKMDFLGLKTLTVIHDTRSLIKEHKNIEFDIDSLPMDDKPTIDLFNRGDTVGVFQLESSGMRELIRRIGIGNIKDLIAMIALYRPGPMNMLDDYVRRKGGKAKIAYDHPLLEPVLKETYGVMLYQEQVQKAANVLAGYTLGEADILRRAMSKKKSDVMEQQRTKFVEGCKKTNRIGARVAGRIFDAIAKFAGYGFPKAHSTAYAIIAYQTAYLKANYPAEFMSALLSSEIGNFDKLPVFIAEVEEMGQRILPPDVNSSNVRFTPTDEGIRFGLAGTKNVGEGAADAIVAERAANGPYSNLIDLCSRVDSQLLNKKVLESLARCGALDSLKMHRARLFNGIDFAMSRAANALRDKRSGQGSLFDLMQDQSTPATAEDLPDCTPWHESELLAGERELLGVYMSGHPLTRYAPVIKKYQLADVLGLRDLPDKTVTRLGGIVAQVNKKITKTTKESMAILHLEDLDGCVEVLVFPEAYQKYGINIQQDTAILVSGELSKREEQPKIIAYEIYPLADAPRHFATRVGIHVPAATLEQSKLEEIKDILRMHPGTVPVTICLQLPAKEKIFVETDDTLRVLPDEDLISDIEEKLGEQSVYVAVNPKPCLNSRPARNRYRRSE